MRLTNLDDQRGVWAGFPNTAFDVVVLAASAGGVVALIQVLSVLPVTFPAAVAVVQHLSPSFPSYLVEILRRRVSLPIQQAAQGEPLKPGVVYIAPPDHHLVIKSDGTLELSQTALVHYVRPSADVLFESAAETVGKRMIAVILTGTGKDGAHGVQAVKTAGGRVIVQDKATSAFYGMPEAAILTGSVDWILPLDAIPQALERLVMTGDYEG